MLHSGELAWHLSFQAREYRKLYPTADRPYRIMDFSTDFKGTHDLAFIVRPSTSICLLSRKSDQKQAGEIAQSVKCLPGKHTDLSLISENHLKTKPKNIGMVVHNCNPDTAKELEVDIPEPCWPASITYLTS